MSRRTVPLAVQTTYRNADELAWERQQRRKRRAAPVVDLPNGPCCARCRHWRTSEDGERFGTCQQLWIIANGRDNGTIFTIDEDRDLTGMPERLNTAPHFTCSRFAQQTETLTTETSP